MIKRLILLTIITISILSCSKAVSEASVLKDKLITPYIKAFLDKRKQLNCFKAPDGLQMYKIIKTAEAYLFQSAIGRSKTDSEIANNITVASFLEWIEHRASVDPNRFFCDTKNIPHPAGDASRDGDDD